MSPVRQAEAALMGRDPDTALALLDQAEATQPGVDVCMTRAVAWRMKGDLPRAISALSSALAFEPYNFVALLTRGLLRHDAGQHAEAAVDCGNALKIAPEPERIPQGLRVQVERARTIVETWREALRAHLKAAIEPLKGEFPSQRWERLDESLDIYCGIRRAFVQEPLLFTLPRLPAIPFHDRDAFPWLGELEAATDIIRAECEEALEHGSEAFAPYIAYPPDAPVNQWGELNHSRRWSSYFLWNCGTRQDAACAACPQTAALLERLPMQDQPGFAPTAMFSALEPRTHIPPHTGSANTRLLVHLPLILPGPARFRVGNEERAWRMGEAWVFDDSIEHEAWNDADALRVILIFDIWNPLLSEGERALITAMMRARSSFGSAVGI